MQTLTKIQLAAALIAAFGLAGKAIAADPSTGNLNVTEKKSPAHIKLADKDAGDTKGADASCKGKDGTCKAKAGATKGKKGSCKGKKASCKGKDKKTDAAPPADSK